MQKPNIDLSQATDKLCDKCGGDTFAHGFRSRNISRLLTGHAQDAVITTELYHCI